MLRGIKHGFLKKQTQIMLFNEKMEENMLNKILKLVVFVMALTFAAPAAAVDFGLRGSYWAPGLNGDLKVDADDLPGTKVDLKSDLGMDEESYPMLEAFVGLGKHHLSLTYYTAEYTGKRELEEEIIFNGETYTAGLEVNSEFSYSVFDVEYCYNLIDLENFLAGGSIGAVVKLKYMDGLVSLDSDIVEKEEKKFIAPIPMLGAHVHLGLLADYLEFRAQLAGIGYGGALLYEGYADVSLTPFPFVDIHAGYRAFVLDVDSDDIELNFDTTGPYIGVSVGF
jgi:hypothetical protein